MAGSEKLVERITAFFKEGYFSGNENPFLEIAPRRS